MGRQWRTSCAERWSVPSGARIESRRICRFSSGHRFDVCVIGSGPAGGWIAKELTEAGARVLLLEAGVEVPPTSSSVTSRRTIPAARYLRRTAAPVLSRRDRSAHPVRRRLDRRRSHPCARRPEHPLERREPALLRLTTFAKARSTGSSPTGRYPTRSSRRSTARSSGRSASAARRKGSPEMPDGEFYGPPMPMRCAERIAGKSCEALGMKLIPVRKAMRVGSPSGSRMPCHYCGHCMKGCDVGAIFTSVNTLLPDARATGRLTLRTNALVRRIEVDTDGRATGVTFVDRGTGRDHAVSAMSSSSRAGRSNRRGSCSTRRARASRTASPTRTITSDATSTATRSARCPAT